MKIFFPVICFLLLSAFAFATIYENNDDADLAIDKVLDETSHYALKKYNIEVVGTGVSFPNGILKGMGLSFQIDHQLSKEKAKMMILDIANFMKDKVNSSLVLIKQMENPPFKVNNISIRFFFKDGRGYSPIHPEFVVISLIKGEFNTKTQEFPEAKDYFIVTSETVDCE